MPNKKKALNCFHLAKIKNTIKVNEPLQIFYIIKKNALFFNLNKTVLSLGDTNLN